MGGQLCVLSGGVSSSVVGRPSQRVPVSLSPVEGSHVFVVSRVGES